MKVFVVDNAHLYKDSNGEYFSPSVYSYDFLKRYLSSFETVRFAGKTRPLVGVDKSTLLKVSGPGVEIVELPFYQGWGQMFKVLPKLLQVYAASVKDVDCCIFRIAQIESFFVYLFSRLKGVPYCVEVVNDPDDFDPFYIRWVCKCFVSFMCMHAVGASYVTEHILQLKYPNKAMVNGGKDSHFQSFYSSIDLDDEMICDTPVSYQNGSTLHIVHVANAINGDAKGHLELIKVAERLIKLNKNIDVTFVGDGTKRKEYEEYANNLGLKDIVSFVGRITDKRILLNLLRKQNLMVLPTKSEGLPRTIIEAMAVGLPCLSTTIAGIPELLDDKYLCAPTDVEGFVSVICRLIDSPDELYDMSKDNLEKAKEYCKSVLDKRRKIFYGKLREYVEQMR